QVACGGTPPEHVRGKPGVASARLPIFRRARAAGGISFQGNGAVARGKSLGNLQVAPTAGNIALMTVGTVDEGYERFAATLERTQWLPRERLITYRDDLLLRLVKFASENSPFYRERLRPLFRAGGEIDLRAWREVPI